MQLASPPDRRPAVRVLVSDVLAGLSRALDITEGHPQGHAARSCLIGMRLADLMRLPDPQRGDLFYALLLKDAGCSSNAARVHQLFGGREQEVKRAVWMRDWRRFPEKAGYALQYAGRGESLMKRALRLLRLAAGTGSEKALFQIRCDRGCRRSRSDWVCRRPRRPRFESHGRALGRGRPAGRSARGTTSPCSRRIIGMAQVVRDLCAGARARAAAFQVVEGASAPLVRPGSHGQPLPGNCARTPDSGTRLHERRSVRSSWRAPNQRRAPLQPTTKRLDQIAEAFAWVIDAKSPFTYDHSRRVAGFATQIAARMGFAPDGADHESAERAGCCTTSGSLPCRTAFWTSRDR